MGQNVPFETIQIPQIGEFKTIDSCRDGRPRNVSPARAGMDPPGTTPRCNPWSFPRTRGDGPLIYGIGPTEEAFPPHARGWTRSHQPGPRHHRVSPARAGMDRNLRPHPRDAERFPRTRGDGPFSLKETSAVTPFPPHARGWTLFRAEPGMVLEVSPARAGMDR